MKKYIFIIFFIIIQLILLACKKDFERKAIVTTDSIVVNMDQIIAYGTIDDVGTNLTDHGFCWSKKENPTLENNTLSLGITNKTGSFSAFIDNIKADYYYIRAFIIDKRGIHYGENKIVKVGGYWKKRADLKGGERTYAISFSIGNKGYLGLGNLDKYLYNDLWEYDPEKDDWVQKADFPGKGRKKAVSFVINGKAYVGTGFSGPAESYTYYNDLWEYDPEDISNGFDENGNPMGKWTKKTDFEGQKRAFAVAFSINSNGYLGTGCYIDYNLNILSVLKDFWKYNPEDESNGFDENGNPMGSWSQIADFGGGQRLGAVSFVVNNIGYVTTGRNQFDLDASNHFWEYNPSSGLWSPKNNPPFKKRNHSVGLAIGQKGYVGTGNPNSQGEITLNDFWEYNPLSDTWTPKANFGEMGRNYAAAFAIDYKGYIATGANWDNYPNNPSTIFKDLWEYTPDQ